MGGDSSALLLRRFGVHQGQTAAGVELLAVLQSLIPAVGFDLNGGGTGLGVDDQFVEEPHDLPSAASVVATVGRDEG